MVSLRDLSGFAERRHYLPTEFGEQRAQGRGDGENGGQFVGYDHHSSAQAVAQFQDQLVKVTREDGVLPG